MSFNIDKTVTQLEAQYNSAEIFNRIDDFQGRFMKDIYDHHLQCEHELRDVEKAVAAEINKV